VAVFVPVPVPVLIPVDRDGADSVVIATAGQ